MIAERLKKARIMSGMSTQQASRFSNMRLTSETIDALERVERTPTEDEFRILAETYEVRLEWLRCDDGPTVVVDIGGLEGLAPNDIAKIVRQLRARQ